MTTFRKQLGILRSRAMYYWKPFNRKRLKKFYAQFVNQGDLCFDIGSHLGNRVRAWDDLGAKVVALEPQPQCLAYLNKKFGQNSNITIIPKAVADKPGSMKMYVSTLTPTVSTLSGDDWKATIDEHSRQKIQWDEEIDVEVVTLDQLIKTYGIPKFCKIDVEDFEEEVLLGLSQSIPCLSLEYLAPCIDKTIACVERLAEIGSYEYNYSYGESQVLNSDNWLGYEEMLNVLNAVQVNDRSGDIYARIIA